VLGPSPSGLIGGSTYTGTILPFLIKQINNNSSSNGPVPTIRYQQVYNQSLFTNLDPSLIYVTTLTVFPFSTNYLYGWIVPKMQINLSSTSKSADNLSSIFSENVGADDTVVFGPAGYDFPGNGIERGMVIFLNRPFRYHPDRGSLLLDVRILDGSGPPDEFNSPQLEAWNSPPDEFPRVWPLMSTRRSRPALTQ